MNPWIGNSIYIVSVIASIIIRIPHDQVSKKTQIAENRKGMTENILLILVFASMVILPILFFTDVLSFANYELTVASVIAGTATMALSLWLFFRSHADLGRNWSITLQVREQHSLVTTGIYKSIRHPMYTSLYLMAVGQVFLLANWIAGPAMLVAFTLMFFSRLRAEEQMMLDKFGQEYESYRQRTKRLIPGLW